MSTPTEQQLRELFAADAATVPDGLDPAAVVRYGVRRRRRAQAAWSVAGATVAVVTAMGVLGLDRPTPHPPAQGASGTTVAPSPTPPTTAGLPRGAKPGDPLADSGAASCVKGYSPVTLAENAFAFDGTVTGISPVVGGRHLPGDSDLRTVTFHVGTWFKGGTGDTAVIDMTRPATGAYAGPSYQVGTRLLVTGMPRWGGAPLDDAIAWTCGFTRYYSPESAAEWATATR